MRSLNDGDDQTASHSSHTMTGCPQQIRTPRKPCPQMGQGPTSYINSDRGVDSVTSLADPDRVGCDDVRSVENQLDVPGGGMPLPASRLAPDIANPPPQVDAVDRAAIVLLCRHPRRTMVERVQIGLIDDGEDLITVAFEDSVH